MLIGLRTAIYPVADLAAAKDWYVQVLGQQPYFDQPFYVGFSVGGFELGLVPLGEASTQGPQPLWGVADIEVAFQHLTARGATPLEPVIQLHARLVSPVSHHPYSSTNCDKAMRQP